MYALQSTYNGRVHFSFSYETDFLPSYYMNTGQFKSHTARYDTYRPEPELRELNHCGEAVLLSTLRVDVNLSVIKC